MSGNPISPGALADAELIAAGYGVPTDPPDPAMPHLDGRAYQGLAGDVVIALAPRTEADPVGLLLGFLAAFGSAVGPGPHVRLGAERHPARLNPVLVGKTARSRKGTAWATLRPVFGVADEDWLTKRVKGGLASGEGLVKALEDGNDCRLFALEPEFARTLAVCDRDGSTLSHILRQAWDSGDLSVMTRKDPLSVTGAHVCVFGNITADELRRRLLEAERANGFANRFLFAWVSRARLLPFGGDLGSAFIAELGRPVRTALDQARRIERVEHSEAGGKLWEGLYHEMADGPGGMLGAITDRAEAQTLRLSLAYALLDGSRTIEEVHVQAAYALWRYCEDSARYIFGDSLGDGVADRLLKEIRVASTAGLDFTTQSAVFGRNVSATRLELARVELERLGHIVTRSENTGGRPRMVSYAVTKQTNQTKKGAFNGA